MGLKVMCLKSLPKHRQHPLKFRFYTSLKVTETISPKLCFIMNFNITKCFLSASLQSIRSFGSYLVVIRNKSMLLLRLSKMVHSLNRFQILRSTAEKEKYNLLPVPDLPMLSKRTDSTILRQHAPYSFRQLGFIHG